MGLNKASGNCRPLHLSIVIVLKLIWVTDSLERLKNAPVPFPRKRKYADVTKFCFY